MMRWLVLLTVSLFLLVGATIDVAAQFAQKEEYSAAAGTLPAWFGTTNTERGFGIGKPVGWGGETAGIIISRNGGVFPLLFTGVIEDTLDMTGVSGGDFILNDADVSRDGLILACNMTTNSATNPFKVYIWDSVTAAPRLALSFTGAPTHRLGDKFTAVGSASDNSLTIWAAAASQDTVYRWNTTDGGATFNVTTITLSDGGNATQGSADVGPVGTGAAEFYVNGNGINPKHYDANGTLLATISGTIVATGSNAIDYFEFGGKKYLWVFQYGAGNNNGRLVDVTAGDLAATVVGVTPTLGANANANGTGDVGYVIEAGEVFLVVLATNNGFGAYTFPTWNTTFQVNMSVQAKKGNFAPAADSVWVRGNFNDWGTSTKLADLDGDSIYSAQVPVLEGTASYKFFFQHGGADNWENDPNRSATIAQDTILPVVYFNNDSIVTAKVPVTFQVNMRVKMKELSFRPGVGDRVRVPGSFNSWNTNTDTLTDLDGDSIYTKTIQLDEGSTIFYKYYKTTRGGEDWEGDPNREFTVPTGGGAIPVVYFNRDSVVDPQVDYQITYYVDMTAFEDLGWFQRALGDSVRVRGSFNGWGDADPQAGFMSRVPGTDIYELIVANTGPPNSDTYFKFFMDVVDSATGFARFGSLYNTDRNGVLYDHPSDRGDGNRIYNYGGGGVQETPVYFFGSINPAGVIAAGDSVVLKFTVDMATSTGFNQASDSVWMQWLDQTSRAAARGQEFVLLTNTSAKIYEGTMTLKGPTHYNMMYVYRYGAAGTYESEGAGLGAQGGRRSRFIQPLGPNNFPDSYDFPLESWIGPPPLPVETPPFVTGVENSAEQQIPLTYELNQNYPNPFNPATTIRYQLPMASRVVLKVYNMIGQEVSTLVDDMKPAGVHMVSFEASNLATGVYFYALEAGSFREVKKMVLLK